MSIDLNTGKCRESAVNTATDHNAQERSAAIATEMASSERALKIGRINGFIARTDSAVEEVLLESEDADGAVLVRTWLKGKRDHFKRATEGVAAPDPEMTAIALFAGLRSEGLRYTTRLEGMDEGVRRDGLAEQKQAAAVLEDCLSLGDRSTFSKISIEGAGNRLNRLSADLKNLSFYLGMGATDILYLRDRFAEAQEGTTDYKAVLQDVDFTLRGCAEHGQSTMVDIFRRLADPATSAADKTRLINQTQALTITLKTLQVLRAQLETRLYAGAGGDVQAQRGVDTIREEISATQTPAAAPRPSERVTPVAEKPAAAVSVIGKQMNFRAENPLMKTLLGAQNVTEARSAVTPEVKRELLQDFLYRIDDRIQTAKRIKSVLEVRNLANVDNGFVGPMGVVYQRLFAAVVGWVPDMTEIAKMKTLEVAKTIFGYDLAKDPRRADELRTHTSLFM